MKILTASRVVALMAAVCCLMSLLMPWAQQLRITDTADGVDRQTFSVAGFHLTTPSPITGTHLAHPWFAYWLIVGTVAVAVVTFVTSYSAGWRWTLATLISAAVLLITSWPPISGLKAFITGGSTQSTAVMTQFGCDIWRWGLVLLIAVTIVGGYYGNADEPGAEVRKAS